MTGIISTSHRYRQRRTISAPGADECAVFKVALARKSPARAVEGLTHPFLRPHNSNGLVCHCISFSVTDDLSTGRSGRAALLSFEKGGGPIRLYKCRLVVGAL